MSFRWSPISSMPWRRGLDHRHRMLLRLELDHPSSSRPSELDPELVLVVPRGVGRDLFERARREGLVRPVRQQQVEDPLLGGAARPAPAHAHHLGLHHVHRQLGESRIIDSHVAPHVADLVYLEASTFRRLRGLSRVADATCSSMLGQWRRHRTDDAGSGIGLGRAVCARGGPGAQSLQLGPGRQGIVPKRCASPLDLRVHQRPISVVL